MKELVDRNTVRQVAEYWGCSVRTVQRRLIDGTLGCLRMGGVIRVTREQVEAYERACATGGHAKTSDVPPAERAWVSASVRRQLIQGVAVKDLIYPPSPPKRGE